MAEKGYQQPPDQGYSAPPYPQGGYPQGGYPQGQYPPSGAPPPYPGQGPNYGPPPVHPQPSTTVIVAPMRFGETPVALKCTYCGAEVVTRTRYVSGLATWLAAGACCVFGLWFGCCLIPFCIDGLSDVTHACPNCQRMVGKYERLH